MDVRLTPSARHQFFHAIETIRRNDRVAALKFRQRAGVALKRLSRFPNSGASVVEFPQLPYREVYVKPY